MTARAAVAVAAALLVTAAALATAVAAVAGLAVADGPTAAPVGAAGTGGLGARDLGSDGPLRGANATVVGESGNVSIVRRSSFAVSAATNRNYTSIRGDPVVAGGRVYTRATGNKLVGDQGQQHYFTALYALNETTLEPDWRVEFEERGVPARPTVVDGTVYAFVTRHGDSNTNAYSVVALDAATGERRWARDLGSIDPDERENFTTPPAISQGRVYTTLNRGPVCVVGDHVVALTFETGPQTLLGLDPETGAVDWRYRNVVAGVGTDGERLYAGYRPDSNLSHGGVAAIDPATGAVEWTHSNGDFWGQLSVDAVANGRVYATRPGPPDSTAVGTLHALDAETGEEAYRVAAPNHTWISPTATYPEEGAVVAVAASENGEGSLPKLVGVNDSAGSTSWVVGRDRLGPGWQTYAGERNFYVYSRNGFSAYRAGDLDGSRNGWFPNEAWSTVYEGQFSHLRQLTESGGDLYALRTTATGSGISVYDGGDGDTRYEFDFEGLHASLTVANETMFVGTEGAIRAFVPTERATGTATAGRANERESAGTPAVREHTPSPGSTSAGLSGRGPLGAPIPVFVGLALGLATSGALAGRRYGFGGGR